MIHIAMDRGANNSDIISYHLIFPSDARCSSRQISGQCIKIAKMTKKKEDVEWLIQTMNKYQDSGKDWNE